MHSGLQLKVLKQYKLFIRACQHKHPSFMLHIKQEFRKNMDISRKDIDYIEYLLRRGEKQLEYIKSPQCDSIKL